MLCAHDEKTSHSRLYVLGLNLVWPPPARRRPIICLTSAAIQSGTQPTIPDDHHAYAPRRQDEHPRRARGLFDYTSGWASTW